MLHNKFIVQIGIVFALALNTHAADFLDRLDNVLSIRSPKHEFDLQLSGLFDLETYFIQQSAPALLFTDDDVLFNPRLSIFVDAQWTKHFYFFAQARFDRGFDPSENGARAALDEYFLRYTPFDDPRVNVQFGKFATVIGNWVSRHFSWDNPLINAPLPYENLNGIWDIAAPPSVDVLLYWGHVPTDEYGRNFGNQYWDKYVRLPIIWGPSYASGAAVSGTIGEFDYAAEIKNAALTSRPESWDLTQMGLNDPTFSGRIGVRPNEMWNLGFSVSSGAYLMAEAASSLPPGRGVSDYREWIVAQDASFAWRHWQLWAEFFETRFEVPRIGDADVFAYYVEGKYKITPQLFAAARWNQQLYGTVSEGNETVQWGNDTWRVDAALGYRFTNYLQAKAQYSYTKADFHDGNNLVAIQLTLKF